MNKAHSISEMSKVHYFSELTMYTIFFVDKKKIHNHLTKSTKYKIIFLGHTTQNYPTESTIENQCIFVVAITTKLPHWTHAIQNYVYGFTKKNKIDYVDAQNTKSIFVDVQNTKLSLWMYKIQNYLSVYTRYKVHNYLTRSIVRW